MECTFGILKGRFAILRHGIRTKSIATCDKLWLTCCAIHNKLLFIDGLHENWETGAKSYYEEEGNTEVRVPFAVNRLNRHENEDDIVETTPTTIGQFDKYTVDGKRIVSKMPLKLFQERLVHHFDIRFKKNDIQWPKRLAM